MRKRVEEFYQRFQKLLDGKYYKVLDAFKKDSKSMVDKIFSNESINVSNVISEYKTLTDSLIDNMANIFVESIRESLIIYNKSLKSKSFKEELKKYYENKLKHNIQQIEKDLENKISRVEFPTGVMISFRNKFNESYHRISTLYINVESEIDKHNTNYSSIWIFKKDKKDIYDLIPVIISIIALIFSLSKGCNNNDTVRLINPQIIDSTKK